jgi:hypothetical protein
MRKAKGPVMNRAFLIYQTARLSLNLTVTFCKRLPCPTTKIWEKKCSARIIP